MATVVGVACRPASRPALGGGSVVELRQRKAGDDQVPGVPSQGLADWQRPDGGDLQDAYGTAERIGHALGCRQRRGSHGPGGTHAKRSMELVLAKSAQAKGLNTPGRFARHPKLTDEGSALMARMALR